MNSKDSGDLPHVGDLEEVQWSFLVVLRRFLSVDLDSTSLYILGKLFVEQFSSVISECGSNEILILVIAVLVVRHFFQCFPGLTCTEIEFDFTKVL